MDSLRIHTNHNQRHVYRAFLEFLIDQVYAIFSKAKIEYNKPELRHHSHIAGFLHKKTCGQYKPDLTDDLIFWTQIIS